MHSHKLVGMNLELTNACPLRCPQCYVALEGALRELPLSEGLYWIEEGRRCGVRYVNLSGGETLCYPYLDELIRACADRGMEASVSLSGVLATRERLEELIRAGVASICVSLNGSTPQINAMTREGYEEAVQTLALLQEIDNKDVLRIINFVLHGSNAGDLPDMIRLCETYNVDALVVLQTKPDSEGGLPDVPDQAQLEKAAALIAGYRGSLIIIPDHCYFELRELLPEADSHDAQGTDAGCGAGLTQISVSAEGRLTPCRHLNLQESFRSIDAYLEESETIRMIRSHIKEDPAWRQCLEH